jgi:chemotaxis protein CheD
MTSGLPEISVQPGQLYVARSPVVLQTILGSCVGATIWSARLGAGALCHGVLPKCPPGADCTEGYRYVDFSIRYLLEQFDSLGATRRELEIKLFGGADVLPVSAARSHILTVGAMNCKIALEVLEKEGLQVAASDLGGLRGRTVHFDTATGDVLVRRLARLRVTEARHDDAQTGTRRKGSL